MRTDKRGIPTLLSGGIIVLHRFIELNTDVELKCSAAMGHVLAMSRVAVTCMPTIGDHFEKYI